MKIFKVALYETLMGQVVVMAKDAKAAEDKAAKILFNDGIEGFNDFKVNDREFNVVEVEEVV